MKIGILSLQGAVEHHIKMVAALGVDCVRVRLPAHLVGLSGIILPGGESSTMLHLLELNQLWNPLDQFLDQKPALGVCAGAILLADKVSHPEQKSFKKVGISAERNSYGRQNESFIETLTPTEHWTGEPNPPGIFIRAPRLKITNMKARPLLRFGQDDVLIEQDHWLAGSYHPELTESKSVHEYFLSKCQNHG